MTLSRATAVCLGACIVALTSAKKGFGADAIKARQMAADDVVSLPRTFYPGTVVDPETDVISATIDEYGILVGMVTGSSVVYTFDVTKAGTYDVSYGLVGGAPLQATETLKMGFLKGRQTCPPIGTEGSLYIENFQTGDWTTVVNYLATPIELEAGDGQEYTLCFERAAWVNLNYICIGPNCSNTAGTVDASTITEDEPVPLPEVTDVCVQQDIPFGSEENSCIEVLCVPEFISLGTPFNFITRFCSSHSRKWNLSLNILDDSIGGYVVGIGEGVEVNYAELLMDAVDTVSPTASPTMTATSAPAEYLETIENNMDGPDGTACGEYTFTVTLDPEVVDKTSILTWKVLMKPVWYDGDDEETDNYPNVIAESSIFDMPTILPQDYAATLGDCPILPSRAFDREDGLISDMIRFPNKPDCVTAGEEFSIDVDVHVATVDMADLRVNLQIGSGVDLYLGAEDVYVGESNMYGLLQYSARNYWTRYTLDFSAVITQNLSPKDNIYLVAFLVPNGAVFDEELGWETLQQEYNLLIEQC